MTPLAGPDAQIARLIQQIIDIGRHRHTWRANDVARVAAQHFGADMQRRATDAQRARADKAEAENARLRKQLETRPVPVVVVTGTDDLPPRRVVELPRHEYEVMALYCEGQKYAAIAAELGLALGTVKNAVTRVADRLGADSPGQAAALVNRRVVALRASERRGKRRVA